MEIEHKMINRRYSMHSGDCYLYENDCICGKSFGGWTEKEADEDFKKHTGETVL